MKELIFLLIFLLSAGSGTLFSVVLRKRLGNKLEELDTEDASGDAPEGSAPEEIHE